MKKGSLLIAFCLGFCLANAQTNWLWAKTAIGNATGIVTCTDSWGNVYATGAYNGFFITFGNTTLVSTAPNGDGSFLIKYDSLGNLLWVKGIYVNSPTILSSITTDSNGNLFATGYTYSDTITIGSITVTTTSPGTMEYLVIKFDSSGNALWAKTAGGNKVDLGTGICIDSSGNAIVVGYFFSSAITFGDTVFTNADGSGTTGDGFITKYDVVGNVMWAKRFGGIKNDGAQAVSCTPTGQIILSGTFCSSTINFDTTILNNSHTDAVFLAKYDGLGNAFWAKSVCNNSDCYLNKSTTDNNGNIYIAGFYNSTIILDTITLTYSGIGASNVYLAKYDPSGHILWLKSGRSVQDAFITAVSADNLGNVYIGGYILYSYSITFDSLVLQVNSNAPSPTFLVKYNSSGDISCATLLSDGAYNDWFGVNADNFGNTCITGHFDSNPFILGNDTLTYFPPYGNIFTAKFTCDNITGIQQSAIATSQFAIFPNPATNQLFIQTNGIPVEEINIYNTTGSLVSSVRAIHESPQQSIDISQLATGVYIAEIKTKDASVKKRWVKM